MGLARKVLYFLMPEGEDTGEVKVGSSVYHTYRNCNKANTLRGRNEIAREALIEEGIAEPSYFAIMEKREELFNES